MKFTVYQGATGSYLFVPDCVNASREAERLHGPLTHCGVVDSDEHPLPDFWETVMADVDTQLYAVVSQVVARRLLHV